MCNAETNGLILLAYFVFLSPAGDEAPHNCSLNPFSSLPPKWTEKN